MLEAKAISKVYHDPSGDVTALHEFSHRFAEGKITAIVGPSGSGKSTLLNLLAGFDDPTSGSVSIDEQEIGHLDERERAELRLRKIGFVFQSYNLISVLSARQNVAFPMGLAGVDTTTRRQRADALLKRFGLGERTRHLPYKLSGGERQRVSIARALANDPAVVFADEPTGNLDSTSGKVVVDALKDVAEDGRSVIIVTHDLRLADTTDVTLGLADGRLTPSPPHAIGGSA